MSGQAIIFDLSKPRTGLWCGICSLPSAYEFDINHIRTTGVTTVSTVRRCPQCNPLTEEPT